MTTMEELQVLLDHEREGRKADREAHEAEVRALRDELEALRQPAPRDTRGDLLRRLGNLEDALKASHSQMSVIDSLIQTADVQDMTAEEARNEAKLLAERNKTLADLLSDVRADAKIAGDNARDHAASLREAMLQSKQTVRTLQAKLKAASMEGELLQHQAAVYNTFVQRLGAAAERDELYAELAAVRDLANKFGERQLDTTGASVSDSIGNESALDETVYLQILSAIADQSNNIFNLSGSFTGNTTGRLSGSPRGIASGSLLLRSLLDMSRAGSDAPPTPGTPGFLRSVLEAGGVGSSSPASSFASPAPITASTPRTTVLRTPATSSRKVPVRKARTRMQPLTISV